MGAFYYEWDDFRGGQSVAHTDINEPKNSWRGENVTIADDDATLVPMYQPYKMDLTGTDVTNGFIDYGTTDTEWSDPTYFDGYIVVTSRNSSATKVHFIDLSTYAVSSYSLPASGTTAGGPPVLVPVSSGVIAAYVGIGTTSIYKVTSGGSITTITAAYGSNKVSYLTLWNARMIGWDKSSDTFVFSNALDFDTSWPTLNYVGVGYSNDGISYIIPRNLDMVVAKPSGWYSVTGVLGANSAVRQMNDTIGILPGDPIAQHNNAVYFTTNRSYYSYSVNIMAISGTRIDVAAYQRFGYENSQTHLARTNLGYLAACSVYNDGTNSAYCSAYILNMQDVWTVMTMASPFSNTAQNLQFRMCKGQVSRFNIGFDQTLYLSSSCNGTSQNKFGIHIFKPNTIEPGKLAGSNEPSTGSFKFPNIATKTPTMIRRVYVEAEMLQIPYPYDGNASIQVNVNNRAVADIDFSKTIGDPSSGYSTAYSFPFTSFTSGSSQIRVMRFNVDNATWGYTQEIQVKFAGMRIRRVWVEGESR